MCLNEKAEPTFLQHPPVPLWHVVKSFEVVIILDLHLENTGRFPLNLQNFDAHLKRRTNEFQVSIHLVYMLASEVKLSQTFI